MPGRPSMCALQCPTGTVDNNNNNGLIYNYIWYHSCYSIWYSCMHGLKNCMCVGMINIHSNTTVIIDGLF